MKLNVTSNNYYFGHYITVCVFFQMNHGLLNFFVSELSVQLKKLKNVIFPQTAA